MARPRGPRWPGVARLLLALLVPALLLAACVGGEAGDGESTGPVVRPTTEVDVPAGATPPPLHPEVDRLPAGTVLVDPGGEATEIPVAVRIAATDDARRFGLMEVADLPDGTGMWFTYDQDRAGGFWMRNTLVDIDIAWVDAAGRIVAIATMEVCDADPCPSYEPGASYRHALEVPAGWLEANDVEVGDIVRPVETSP